MPLAANLLTSESIILILLGMTRSETRERRNGMTTLCKREPVLTVPALSWIMRVLLLYLGEMIRCATPITGYGDCGPREEKVEADNGNDPKKDVTISRA